MLNTVRFCQLQSTYLFIIIRHNRSLQCLRLLQIAHFTDCPKRWLPNDYLKINGAITVKQ